MRFHIGCSFSLRKLRKFLFPILIGLFSYFLGSGLFGFTPVYADSYVNLSTYNNIYPYDLSTDMQSIACGTQNLYDFTIDFINHFDKDNSNYFLVVSPVWFNTNSGQKGYEFTFIPKGSLSNLKYQWFSGESYNRLNNQIVLNYRIFDNSSFSVYRFTLTINPTCNSNDTYYSVGDFNTLLGYLNSGDTIPSNFVVSNSNLSYNGLAGGFSNATTYNSLYYYFFGNDLNYVSNNVNQLILGNFRNKKNVDLDFGTNVLIPFYSSVDLIYSINNNLPFANSSYDYYLKSFNFVDFDLIVTENDKFPTYSDLYGLFLEGSSLPTYNQIDDLFVSNIPINSYSNLEVKFSLNYFNPNYSDSLTIQPLFYGRVNNSTYYSYEPIDCSLTGGTSYGDFTLNGTYHISSCTTSLTNYDSIILRLRMTSLDLISNFRYSTNLGHINTAPVYNGSNNVTIMDYFGGLSPDFSVLISSTQANSRLEFKGNERYTFAQRINKATNDISVLAQTGVIYFGTNTNSNIMLYNYTLENNTNTDLYLFFSDDVIVSFSDNGAYTYYDDTDTITTENITIKYLIDTSEYDSSSLTGIINNFLDDIDTSLVDMHILLNNIYNSLPSYLNYLILVLYTLFLLYLLFKILKR